jgi:large subunit ribosomal protein L17
MRHRVADKKFNRNANARKALFTGLLRNLAEHGSIVTTRARAKAIKPLVDRMVSQAQDSSLASRRLLHETFGKRDVVNTLVDVIAPKMKDRTSGFTRIIPFGNRRGDNTPMVKMEFSDKPENLSLSSGKEYPKKVKATKGKGSAAPKAVRPAGKAAKSEKPVKKEAKKTVKKPTKKAVASK